MILFTGKSDGLLPTFDFLRDCTSHWWCLLHCSKSVPPCSLMHLSPLMNKKA